MKYYKIQLKLQNICAKILLLFSQQIYMSGHYMEDGIGRETADRFLNVTKDTVRKWIKKTDIPSHKSREFEWAESVAWIKSRCSS